MGSTFGKTLKISLFGESHGEAVGIVLDGFTPGLLIDIDRIERELKRRAGGGPLATSRVEADEFQILSGIFEGRTTGAPIAIMIPNTNTRSGDYSKTKDVLRPNHADYTALVKYGGFHDYRGGGHFSARITAALVAAGALAKQLLERLGVYIGGHIYAIDGVYDMPFHDINLTQEQLSLLSSTRFPVIDSERGEDMQSRILAARNAEDSVGGVVEVAAIGLPVGIGEPLFDSVEGVLSHIFFAIPAVKGVEFGAGFEVAKMHGSTANDAFHIENGEIRTHTNNCGGVLGGITSGMPLIARIAFKPTPSISLAQKSVNIREMSDCELKIEGRHDPCVVPRAVSVVEAAMALGILDLWGEVDVSKISR